MSQIRDVPAYSGYIQVGFDVQTFLVDWVPSLRAAKCLIGVNYAGKGNVGLDLPISEVVAAITSRRSNDKRNDA